MAALVPARHQPPLDLERFVVTPSNAAEALETDVLFVGAGPAGLAGAIELARLIRLDNESGGGLGEVGIGVLEKAGSLGEHSLSGAVVNPRAFRELFPDLDDREFPFRAPVTQERVLLLTKHRAFPLPTPPTMHNRGFYVASLCEIVRWLGERAEKAGVDIFTGFPAEALLTEGNRVLGVRTAASGLDREGKPMANSMPATEVRARVTVLSEGTRGLLSQAWCAWQKVGSPNPQIFALGVKELWETKRPLESVIHTLGWPLANDVFGGSFVYPLEPNLLALGLVVGLDYGDASTDVHELLQRLKLHPFLRPYLEGGEMVEWGAKTIPEGGYYSLPERVSGDGLILVGDAAGFVDVPSLKGVHYAMQTGIFAARAIFEALKADDPSAVRLAAYDASVRGSYVVDDLRRTRNMRLAFRDGFWVGGAKAALMSLTGGRFPGRMIGMSADAETERRARPPDPFIPDGKLTFSKLDSVFKSGNATRDTIPSHLHAESGTSGEVADFYAHLCPAGVYERADGGLKINPPNCVDCKATDVLGPRWTPREGGSGPRYRRL